MATLVLRLANRAGGTAGYTPRRGYRGHSSPANAESPTASIGASTTACVGGTWPSESERIESAGDDMRENGFRREEADRPKSDPHFIGLRHSGFAVLASALLALRQKAMANATTANLAARPPKWGSCGGEGHPSGTRNPIAVVENYFNPGGSAASGPSTAVGAERANHPRAKRRYVA